MFGHLPDVLADVHCLILDRAADALQSPASFLPLSLQPQAAGRGGKAFLAASSWLMYTLL